MARKRWLHPEIWTDPDFIKLNHRQRLLFVGAFSNADDEGLLEADYDHIKAAVFPGDVYDVKNFEDDLKTISNRNLFVLFSAKGKRIVFFPKWFRYQILDHPYHSKLPRPNKKLMKRYPDYANERLKYFRDDSENGLGAFKPPSPSYKRGEGGEGDKEGGYGGEVGEKVETLGKLGGNIDGFALRVAEKLSKVFKSPKMATIKNCVADLVRQKVPTDLIWNIDRDSRYCEMDWFEVFSELKRFRKREAANGGSGNGYVDAGSKAGDFFSIGGDEFERRRIEKERDYDRSLSGQGPGAHGDAAGHDAAETPGRGAGS